MVFKGFPNWGQLYERTSDDRELVMTRRLVMTPSCGLCRRFIPAEGGEASESSGVYLRESELRYFDDGAIFYGLDESRRVLVMENGTAVGIVMPVLGVEAYSAGEETGGRRA